MKRFSIMALLVVLIVGFAGTAMADRVSSISDKTGTQAVTYGPVVIQDANGTGTTLYVLTGSPAYSNFSAGTTSGVTLYAVDTQRTKTDGSLEMKVLANGLSYGNGVTLVGGPVVATKAKAGTSVYYTILAPNAFNVGSPGSGYEKGAGLGAAANTGITIFGLDGVNGTTRWSRGIAINGAVAAAATAPRWQQVTPLTLDDENVATSGATLYVGVGADFTQAGTGATIYSIDADNGDIVGQYRFPGLAAARSASSVSGFFSAPFISGASLYILGWDFNTGVATGGVTLHGLHRNNLAAGVSAVGLVNPANMDYSHAQTPTPCVSGNSIFVVAAGNGTQAGVTVYDKYTLAKVYFTNYGPVPANCGVSASPVATDDYIVLSTMSAVTNYKLSNLSTNTKTWTIDLAKSFPDATYQIYGTPAISNGYVYIPVLDVTGLVNKGFILRCRLDSTTGEPTKIGPITEAVAADPIISAGYVYAATYNPTVYQIDGGVGARAYTNWQQFKFDKAKRGYSYDPPQAQPWSDDDGGCFISTLK